jgi:hypothetical protein
MAVLYTQHFVQFFDDNGNPLSGGRLYTYDAGGTTPKATYTDAAGSTANANPVVLDAAGRATVFLDGATYRFDLKTSGDVLVRSTDNIQSFGVVQSNIQNSNLALMPATTVKANALISSAMPTDVSFGTFAYLLNLPSGMQNMFRNPFMEVAQRGTSGTNTAGVGYYTLDGWAVLPTGANISWQQAGAIGNATTYSSTSLGLLGASGLTGCTVYHRIESAMAGQIAGKRVTVQFLISNQTGAPLTPTIATYYPTATDNHTSVVSDLGAGTSLQTIASGATATVAYTFNTNSLATRGYGFDLNFGAQLNGAGKNVYISAADIRFTPDAPLGLNNAPPRPEYRNRANEQTLCQRYYEIGGVYGYNNAGGAGNTRSSYHPFRVFKRTNPVITLSNIVYTGAGANSLTVDQFDNTYFGTRTATTSAGNFTVTYDFAATSEL